MFKCNGKGRKKGRLFLLAIILLVLVLPVFAQDTTGVGDGTSTEPLSVVILGIIAFAISEILPFIKKTQVSGVLHFIWLLITGQLFKPPKQ